MAVTPNVIAVIKSFADADTESVFDGEPARRFPTEIQRTARRKLLQLAAADRLEIMRLPPGNRRGQHSIRINDQWRICFRWEEQDAHDVEIVDYH